MPELNHVRRMWLILALLLAFLAIMLAPRRSMGPSFVVQRPPEVIVPEGRLGTVFDLARPASLMLEVRAREGNRSFVRGMGSGFFISADGYVLTAYHVVMDAGTNGSIVGVGSERERYNLRLVGFDAYLDLALLKADVRTEVAYLPLAERSPRVGSDVVAIGNSRGDFLQGRVGRVTQLEVEAARADFASGTIELTAALAPGDSGGPVLNGSAQVVGVVSYISFIPEGIPPRLELLLPSFIRNLALPRQFASYAVPVTLSSTVLEDLRAGVQRDTTVVGIIGANYNPRATGVNLGPLPGALVRDIAADGPAARAGIRPPLTRDTPEGREVVAADVIVAVNDLRVNDLEHLKWRLRDYRSGDTVTLTVQRGQETLKMPLELAARSAVQY